MAGESAIYKKFRAEQDTADAAYKKWEQEQWDKNGAEWTKQGYTRTADPNSAWGSTWKKNPVAGVELAPVVKPEEKVELKEPEVKVVPPVVEEAPKFSSYDDIMKQSWARRSHYGANNVWVDENGQKIADHKTHQGKKYQTFVTTGLFGDHNDLTYAYDPETGNIRRLHENWLGNIGDGWSSKGATGVVNNGDWGSLSDMLAQYGITYKKQGGTMNKVKYFAQGGQPQTLNDIQRQVEALVEAALSGDQKANQQVNQIMEAAKAGDQKAALLAQMIQVAAQKLQGQATMNKWGSKLQYIRSLKFAKGGKTCPVCEGGNKVKVAKKDIDKETYQRLSSEQKTDADRHYLGSATSDNKDGSYNISHKPTALDSTHISRKVMSKNMSKKYPEKKECGGKAKKHYFGGWL